jgi:hypothetical protein
MTQIARALRVVVPLGLRVWSSAQGMTRGPVSMSCDPSSTAIFSCHASPWLVKLKTAYFHQVLKYFIIFNNYSLFSSV